MSVYVDHLFEAVAKGAQAHAVGARNGHRWCHLWADTDEELHAFATRIGMKRAWHQPCPPHSISHYDLTPGKRAQALKLGAVEGSIWEAVRKAKAEQGEEPRAATIHRMAPPPAAPAAEPTQARVRVPHDIRLISGLIVRANRYLATWHPDGRVTVPVKHFGLSDELKHHRAAEAWQWPKGRKGETSHVYVERWQFEMEAAEAIPDHPEIY